MPLVPPPPSPNFGYLAYHDPRLSVLATQAEGLFAVDPSACLGKLRLFAEVLARRAAAALALPAIPDETQAALVGRLGRCGAVPETATQIFTGLRMSGNRAVHDGAGDAREALHQLKMARELGVWFQRSFGNNKKFDPGPFVPPAEPSKVDAGLAAELDLLRAELAASRVSAEAARAAVEAEARARLGAEQLAAQLKDENALWAALAAEVESKRSQEAEAFEARLTAELAAVQAKAALLTPATQQAAVERARAAGMAIELDEADTRRLIDQQLSLAGWEADSVHLTHAGGARPVKGKNQAIAEWPTETGPVDYALFAGLTAIALVEAKKMSVDVSGVLKQARRYAKGFRLDGDAVIAGGPWPEGNRVPFLFATNGRPYLKQLKTKSGIWFCDVRRPQNLARALPGWYTPEGLVDLGKQDEQAAHGKLEREPTAYLGLRDYQLRAIDAVEKAIEGGQRSCLVAMATGTGKTRTAIGLVYRLLKTQRFRRVLFLVDRSALGEQTEDALGDMRLEGGQTFADIYGMKGLDEAEPESATKLHIATIQGMVKRILSPSAAAGGGLPPVDRYDCVVVDECHRGYTLDQEMSEVELRFRDLADYISKYSRVLDHFDAVKIGLTATPAKHTSEIFGPPVFLYSYREAVIDGCLVDHEEPFPIRTELGQQGMLWAKGATMRRFDPRKQAEELCVVEDEVKLEIEVFNSRVITESFNRVVCAALAEEIDPTLPGKTLIFCATDAHADLVVDLLKQAFALRYGSVEDGAVEKITGAASVDRPLERIRHFKNERLPSVVVTVDLLTTGIDVPKIVNIVFLRRVKSRILYEQMLGRATRLCPAIEKTSFRIFDAVDIYGALEPVSTMGAVVQNVSLPFEALVGELSTAPDAEAQELSLEQLLARLQRKRRAMKDEALERFEALAGMGPEALVRSLKGQPPASAAAFFRAHPGLVPFLDEGGTGARTMIISDHADARVLIEHQGRKQRPEDFLEAFAVFLKSKINDLPALIVVTQRPRDLTRAELKALKLALDGAGYSETALRSAWKGQTNADIAASIVGFIRRAALGDALVPYAQRVDRAVAKIVAGRSFTQVQRKWLERLGKQLKIEEVVDRAALDRGQFKDEGGFARLDKVFDGELERVLGDLQEAVWDQAG